MGSREKSCIRHKVIWGACRPQTPDVWVDLVTKRDQLERWMDVYRVPTSNHLSFLFHQKENISSLTWVGRRINTVISWMKEKLLVAQWWLTHCDPMDYSPPGSSVQRILQARLLEWVSIPSSRGSSQPGIKPESPKLQADCLPSELPGKPFYREWSELKWSRSVMSVSLQPHGL